ncbi:histamine N-methyltransferase-like [Oculina patagonica]
MESKPLSSSHDANLNAFQAYISNSTLRETVKSYSSEIGKHDVEILKVVARSLCSSHVEKPSIHTCIVEPSSPLIADFQRSVSPLPESLASLADVSFEWRETRFKDFICNSLPLDSEYYHMTHFICSLYYMDAENSLRSCFKQLTDGGAMFCLVIGEESFFTKLPHRFKGKLKYFPMSDFRTGKDVAAIAERNNWKYEEFPKVQYEIDVTSCFDKSSQTGSFLLDFLTQQIDFQGTAGRVLYNEMMEYLTESSISDSSGRKILSTELAIVAIYK